MAKEYTGTDTWAILDLNAKTHLGTAAWASLYRCLGQSSPRHTHARMCSVLMGSKVPRTPTGPVITHICTCACTVSHCATPPRSMERCPGKSSHARACMHACTHTHTHKLAHARTHMHTHTLTCTRMQAAYLSVARQQRTRQLWRTLSSWKQDSTTAAGTCRCELQGARVCVCVCVLHY